MFEQKLIILFSVCHGSKIWGLDWSRLLGSRACAVSGRSSGLLRYYGAFSLSCDIASVASHIGEGGSESLWGGGIHLCLGSWLWSWISWGPFRPLGLVITLSLPFLVLFLFYFILFYFFNFIFRALWFGIGLLFDGHFPLRLPFLSQLYFCVSHFQ